jgi:hypothetical protein
VETTPIQALVDLVRVVAAEYQAEFPEGTFTASLRAPRTVILRGDLDARRRVVRAAQDARMTAIVSLTGDVDSIEARTSWPPDHPFEVIAEIEVDLLGPEGA